MEAAGKGAAGEGEEAEHGFVVLWFAVFVGWGWERKGEFMSRRRETQRDNLQK
jgi:hypothetical protein